MNYMRAMRYGGSNPLEERKEDDLGRFGLGLKSASLSQCRKLVVISKKKKVRYVDILGIWIMLWRSSHGC